MSEAGAADEDPAADVLPEAPPVRSRWTKLSRWRSELRDPLRSLSSLKSQQIDEIVFFKKKEQKQSTK